MLKACGGNMGLKNDFKKVGGAVKKAAKDVEKGVKTAGKEVGKEAKNAGKEIVGDTGPAPSKQ
jgi:hypothetical protein